MSVARSLRRIAMGHECWLPEADRQLVQQYKSGVDVAEIAESFGRTVSAVRTRVGTLGLQRRKTTKG
ncbi:hypothetical protein ASG20_04495 [Sphingomonas sp. Leaf198]|nr:hypothetical protein ASG20_04495 [Sphingomonas sp. Leaf198]